MAVTVSLNGTDYTIPSPRESNDWGAALNAYLVALATAAGGLALTTVGATPNANGSSLASGVLQLQPVSLAFPGVMTAAMYQLLVNLGSQLGAIVQTTDNNPLGLITLESLPEGYCRTYEVHVSGNQQDGTGDRAGYGLVGVFQNDNGVVTQVGSTAVLYAVESNAAWNAAFYVVDSLSPAVQVTGASATIVNWEAQARMLVQSAL